MNGELLQWILRAQMPSLPQTFFSPLSGAFVRHLSMPKNLHIIYVLSMLGFTCECLLHAPVCTLLPDIIIYGVYAYKSKIW